MTRQAVVTGLGVVSPLGIGAQAHWKGLLRGVSAVSRLERLARLGVPVHVAAEVPAEDVAACLQRLPRKQLKLFNRTTTFAMTAAMQAAEEAGLSAPVPEPTRAGVVLGTLFIPYPIQHILRCLPGMESAEDAHQVDLGRALKHSLRTLNPLDMSLKIVPNLTAGHIAIAYGLRGACRTVSDGWTGGMHAIGHAMAAIRDGHLDLVFCGGAECPLEDIVFADLCSTDLLAPGITPPERTCQPFGRARCGTAAGEGAAVLVVESREHAERRGVRIRAVLAGFGAASGGPDAAGIRASCSRAMRSALADGGRGGVDLVSANGSGGATSDLAEAEALQLAFGSRGDLPEVHAAKGAHGDLFSAAGPLAVATAVLALEHETIPPSVNCEEPDPACGLPPGGRIPRERAGLRTILVSALGAFGEAACVVVGRPG